MAPRKPQPTADDAKPAASGARITKTRTARGTNTNTNINVNPTTLSTASSATHHIKGYKNGILNLEKTPSHLVSIVQRNNTDSPLLRLPAEIRIRIWNLAMCGGPLVFLPDNVNRKGCAASLELKIGAGEWELGYPRGSDRAFKVTKLPAAFRLPEVCRQVYAETVLVSYSVNTFYFLEEYLSRNGAVQCLMAAQRQAISFVQIDPHCLGSYMGSGFRILEKPLTSVLPNLKVILVSTVAIEYVRFYGRVCSASVGQDTDEEWRRRVAERLTYVHGDGIMIEFE